MLQKMQSPFGQQMDQFQQNQQKNENTAQSPQPQKQTSNFGMPNHLTPDNSTQQETPKFEAGQYDFMPMVERTEPTTVKVGTKRRSRNTPPRPAASERSRQASSRMRDTNGSFTSRQKTDVLDLTFKLHSSEFECNKLRKEVAGKDQEMAELKARLQEFERRAHEQQIHVQFLEMVQQRQALEHLDVIRSFKARTQYLSQLEKLFEERRRRAEGQTSPSPNSPSKQEEMMIGSPDVTNLSLNETPTGVPEAGAIEPQQNLLAETHPNMFQQVPSTPVVGITPETVNPFTFHGPLPNVPANHAVPAVPATWFNYESLWNEAVLPAFREKIDFSAIQLRHYGSPNIVEQAKMEYYEAHRRWQEQLQQVNNLPLSPRPKIPKHKIATNAIHSASFAKINFKDEISRLKKINSIVKQNEHWDIHDSFSPDTNSMNMSSPMLQQSVNEESQKEMIQETSCAPPTQVQESNNLFLNGMGDFHITDDHMDMCLSPAHNSHVADDHDAWFNADFFTAPAATIWNTELEKKDENGNT